MSKQLKVSGGSPVKELAGSIFRTFEDGETDIELRAIGASSVNQMYKALATARSLFAKKGLDLSVRPGYDEVMIDDNERTVLIARLVIK